MTRKTGDFKLKKMVDIEKAANDAIIDDIVRRIEVLEKDQEVADTLIDNHRHMLEELRKWKSLADEGMNTGAKRRTQLEERQNILEDRTSMLEESNKYLRAQDLISHVAATPTESLTPSDYPKPPTCHRDKLEMKPYIVLFRCRTCGSQDMQMLS